MPTGVGEEQDLIREFLIESSENLARLDREMVDLECRPGDQALLAGVFRTVHTLKGTCGCLGFGRLEALTHLGENILSQVRSGERELTPSLVSLVLEMVDAVRRTLDTIERTGGEGQESHSELCARLEAAALNCEPGTAPAHPAGTPSADAAAAKISVADSTIRVDVGLLDNLMNLVGELALARNQILQFNGLKEDAAFSAACQKLNLITTRLQESVRKTRMQPIGVVWNKVPRVVRDLAAACGKQISLEMDGAGTELDRTIIEAIKDPIIHIVRNCCDHGIERPDVRERVGKPLNGLLSLRAFHEDAQVNIEITDDGSGIDVEKVRARAVQLGMLSLDQAGRLTERELVHLVFRPGFSTAGRITTISGRGVGMDVVKTNIEKIGGTVDLISRKGYGTTTRIRIPLTPATIPGLVVAAPGERFVIPQFSPRELARLEADDARGQAHHQPG